VTAAGVLLLAAVAGLTIGTVLLKRSERVAQANFETALEGIDESVSGVSEDFWLDEPAMLEMRRKVLNMAHDAYMKLLETHPGDQRLRQQFAKTKRLLGELYLRAGRWNWEDEGIALVEQSVRLYEELLRQAPEDREVQFGLAHAHHALAEFQLQKGVLEDGEKEVDCAIGLLERLTAEEPGDKAFRSQLAWSYNLRATAKGYRGDVESGLEDNRKVLEIVESCGITVPRIANRAGLGPWPLDVIDRFGKSSNGSLVLMPRAYTNCGIMLNSAGRNAEAARVLQEATAFDRWLVEQDPRPGQFRHALALTLLHTGHVQVELGRPARAEPALREAREQMRRLCQDEPLVSEYAATRLLVAGYLGAALFRSGRTTAADEFLREVRGQGEDVLDGPGKSRVLRAQHARLLHLLGRLQRESENVAQGLELTQEAREKLERALEEAPGDPSLCGALLGAREELALCRFLRGDINRDQCIDELRGVLAERRKLAGPLPTRAPRFQGELAASAALLARLLLEAGRPAEALACVDEVLPDHEQFVQEEQERAKKRAEANNPPDKRDPRTYEPWPVFLSDKPVEPKDLELRRQWVLLLARRSAALARVGRGTEAVEPIRQAIAMTEGLVRGDHELLCPPASPLSVWSFFAEELDQEPCYLYDLACHLALASTLADNAGLTDPAGQAAQALRDLVASGFDNAYKLRTDPALDPLRQRPDFEKLVRELEARVKGKEPT
jgi:tetratricopeptide (TPR) repeat protein